MEPSNITVSPKLLSYIREVSLREHPALAHIRENTRSHPCSKMQITPEEGQFMTMLMKLIGARTTLEVGVFTGYSTCATALGLPDDGRIIALDRSHEWTSRAKRFWDEAGIGHKIELRIGEGTELLAGLRNEGYADSIDFVFIDADKKNYDAYYEHAITLTRPGGLIMIDNTLWRGKIIWKTSEEHAVHQLRAFNEKLHGDERIDITILPMADGITLARKR
ncbi:MAG: class I SAM-dependent methyltransferase [Spirochaetota bacterium]